MHPPTGLDPANAPRLQTGPGIEVWYYLLEMDEAHFWFRHVVCHSRHGAGWAELQAWRFDAAGCAHVCERFPLTSLRSSERFFFVQTGKSWLRQSGAWGEISAEEKVQWELDWQPNAQGRPLLPPLLQGGATQAVLAQPWLLATGTIAWGRHHYVLRDIPALQGHMSSRALPSRWWWGSASAEDIQIETLAVWLHSALPPMTACTLFYEGENWLAAGWEPLWRNRSQIGQDTWTLQVQQGDRRAELEWRIPHFYTAPDVHDGTGHYQLQLAAQAMLEVRLFARQSGPWKLQAHLELSGWVETLQKKRNPVSPSEAR